MAADHKQAVEGHWLSGVSMRSGAAVQEEFALEVSDFFPALMGMAPPALVGARA